MGMNGRVPPGPRGEPVLGNARGFQKDIINTLLSGWREHGGLVKFDGIGPLFPVYLFAHPDYVNVALRERPDIYPKTPFISDKWRMVVGEGLICSEGDFWLHQRRLAQPMFDPKLIMGFGPMMTDTAGEMLDRWQRKADTGQPIDMAHEMTLLALAILGKAMFSADWDVERMAPAVEVAIGHAYKRIEAFVALPETLPTPGNRRFARAKATLDEIIYGIIRERHRTKAQNRDLLQLLMDAEDPETGQGMGDEQVRNEVMTFMFGGHETVAAGLAWTLYLLSKHPEVTRRMRDEALEVVGEERVPTTDDIPQLEYTNLVIQESLRLYPPVWLISRTPTEDNDVGPYRIPAGSMVLLSSYIAHRSPEFWDNPEGFDPERFTPERSEGRPKHVWFPFSGGPRQCIGGYFGLTEMKLVLPMILQRFQVDLVPGHPVVPKPGITLGMKHGLLMTVKARQPQAAAA
jgi:cytochrome P450